MRLTVERLKLPFSVPVTSFISSHLQKPLTYWFWQIIKIHGRRQQGSVAPLDFHIWYKY